MGRWAAMSGSECSPEYEGSAHGDVGFFDVSSANFLFDRTIDS
jgi:hypothetical protein